MDVFFRMEICLVKYWLDLVFLLYELNIISELEGLIILDDVEGLEDSMEDFLEVERL